jgi:hypothetical protein
MNQLFDTFSNADLPALTLCTPNKVEIFSLPVAYGIKNTIRYNALSELEFDYSQSSDGGITTNAVYPYLKGKMLVSVDNGVDNPAFYIINSCPENNSGSVPSKHIVAVSLESEMLSRRVTGFTGTYAFTTLLHLRPIILRCIIFW